MMEGLVIQHGGTMMISMNISGLLYPKLSAGLIFINASATIELLLFVLCRSPTCFELGWPMKRDSAFLREPKKRKRVS